MFLIESRKFEPSTLGLASSTKRCTLLNSPVFDMHLHSQNGDRQLERSGCLFFIRHRTGGTWNLVGVTPRPICLAPHAGSVKPSNVDTVAELAYAMKGTAPLVTTVQKRLVGVRQSCFAGSNPAGVIFNIPTGESTHSQVFRASYTLRKITGYTNVPMMSEWNGPLALASMGSPPSHGDISIPFTPSTIPGSVQPHNRVVEAA